MSTQDKINNLTKLMNQAKMQGKTDEVRLYKKAIKTLKFWG